MVQLFGVLVGGLTLTTARKGEAVSELRTRPLFLDLAGCELKLSLRSEIGNIRENDLFHANWFYACCS